MQAILESYLDSFIHEEDRRSEHVATSVAFERFVNHCVISTEGVEVPDLDSVCVGGSGDLGIDGVAILVNDYVVNSTKDVDYFMKANRRLDVMFIFVQSKNSERFDSGDVLKFMDGVEVFFGNVPVDTNDAIRHAIDLKNYIYSQALEMDEPPACHLYYATSGMWKKDAHLLRLANRQQKRLLQQGGILREVEFHFLGDVEIRRMYRELRGRVVAALPFERHTILPPMGTVEEAYLGIVPVKEYLSLICDSDGRLRRGLFDNNVRDFQGNNPVNAEIDGAIKDNSRRSSLHLLNNGVTIIARQLNKVGALFRLTDYQVVNGCQTSHVLYRNRDVIDDQTYLPLKLIVTSDIEVTNEIVVAANRQTPVTLEAFESLTTYQKELEEFYATFGRGQDFKLFYERRAKQYDSQPVPKRDIVTLTMQIKSFVAMFLNEPQSTHRYYGELLEAYRDRMFIDGHSMFPYYVSAYTLITLDRLLFDDSVLENWVRGFRYHVLMMVRLLAETSDVPYLNSRGIDQYCRSILNAVTDERKSVQLFKKAVEMLRSCLDDAGYAREAQGGDWQGKGEASRLRSFTQRLREAVEKDIGRPTGRGRDGVLERTRGRVKWFSFTKGFGFLEVDGYEKGVFLSYGDINVKGYPDPKPGQEMDFVLARNNKGYLARDARFI